MYVRRMQDSKVTDSCVSLLFSSRGNGEFPSPAWATVTGGFSTSPLLVLNGTVISVIESNPGTGLQMIQISFAQLESSNNSTHTVLLDLDCDRNSGVIAGSTIGPFQIAAISTVRCPSGTAQGCDDSLECLSSVETSTNTMVGSKEVGTENTTSAETRDEITLNAVGFATETASPILCSTTSPNFERLAEGDTVSADNQVFIVSKIVSDGNTVCVTVSSEPGALSKCQGPAGCHLQVTTTSTASAQLRKEGASITTTADIPFTYATHVTDVFLKQNKIEEPPAVCTFGVYPGGMADCSGSPPDTIDIQTSVGYTTGICAAHTTVVTGVNTTLYLTAQPVCQHESVDMEWTMCSWRPNYASDICLSLIHI